jgi:hypothetical protein
MPMMMTDDDERHATPSDEMLMSRQMSDYATPLPMMPLILFIVADDDCRDVDDLMPR